MAQIAQLTAILANVSSDKDGKQYAYRRGQGGGGSGGSDPYAMRYLDFLMRWDRQQQAEEGPADYNAIGLRHKAVMDSIMAKANAYFGKFPEEQQGPGVAIL